jgi:D-cysteine desulfhydrase
MFSDLMRCMHADTATPHLFRAHPALAAGLAHVALVERPTPVERLRRLEREIGGSELWIKRDDLSARSYAGNKVRKLEFLLAAARASGATEVLTFGAAGSNHALATAIYARALGLRSISMLIPEVNARAVRRNLLASWHAGAELHHYPDEARLKAALRYQLQRHESTTGRSPCVIAGGGSSPLGVIGFVEAALELRAQIDAGLLPPPARIYLALGTTGTAAGLRLGLDVAGVDAQLIAVRVVHPDIGNAARLALLYRQTASMLAGLDGSFPRTTLDPASVVIRHEYYGGRYAQYTGAGMAAAAKAMETEGLKLDGTYTGKAFAALLHDASRAAETGPTLFWHSCNTRPLDAEIDDMDYRTLPRAFHRYFEEDVQPLDRGA